MKLTTDHKGQDVIDNYPDYVVDYLNYFRKLILNTAEEIEGLDNLE